VVGGIGSASGALFAGLILAGFPIAVGIWPILANLNRVLPGTMGVALGRNPNGAVRDIGTRYGVLREAPLALWGMVLTIVIACALAVSGTISGWDLTFSLALALVLWPLAAEWLVARRAPPAEQHGLEWAGLTRPMRPDELRTVDDALQLEEVPA
jgi:hypothetical protein